MDNIMKRIINVASMLLGIMLFVCLIFVPLGDATGFWIGLCALIFSIIPLINYSK